MAGATSSSGESKRINKVAFLGATISAIRGQTTHPASLPFPGPAPVHPVAFLGPLQVGVLHVGRAARAARAPRRAPKAVHEAHRMAVATSSSGVSKRINTLAFLGNAASYYSPRFPSIPRASVRAPRCVSRSTAGERSARRACCAWKGECAEGRGRRCAASCYR